MESAQHATYQTSLPSKVADPSSSYPAPEQAEESHYEPNLEQSVTAEPPVDSSRSYAARAAARPDLFLDTSPPDQPQLAQSPASQEDLYNPPATSAAPVTRQATVSGRSPLQNLERTMSKGEKRAKLEKAENVARQRSTGSRNPKAAAWPSAPQSTSKTASLEKPLPPPPTTATGSYDSGNSRVSSYGYDSSLTGGAAAAAVGAYQASKRRQYDPSETVPLGQYNNYGARGANRSVSGPPAQGYYSTSNEVRKSPPRMQDSQYSLMYDPYATRSQESQPLTDQNNARESTLPPTAAGQQPRKQVAFQNDGQFEYMDQDQGTSRRQQLKDLLHRDRSEARRYQGSSFLDEWKRADTVVLTSAELELDDAPSEDKTWWEQGGPTIARGRNDSSLAANGFQPSLNLRCGPLLRYSGITRDQATEKLFWRGSIMIVTDDATSSYQTPPMLRMFKQTMSLARSSGAQESANMNGESSNQVNPDPIAGSPKMSRNGHTLYVKPVQNLHSELDLSLMETEEGLFSQIAPENIQDSFQSRISVQDGEKSNLFRETKAFRLHAEKGVTFWRFNIQIELTSSQNRIAYRINQGPAIGFWVPAKDQTMNIAFHSCNGFSLSVDSNTFSGPDPLWRDILNTHQFRPFHCLLGGGDQLYNDAAMKQTRYFQAWLALHNPEEKHSADFTEEMQDELEHFYLNRYAMWFSQGLFGLANSQIPMVNIWDDHDIIDGFGSYPHHFMTTPVFSGVGSVAFKYYMLFQHQSVVDEMEDTEPSWLLGATPGPYIKQLSRSLFLSLGQGVTFLGLDCRTERKRDEILCQETYDLVFDRCRREIELGETKHLIVLLGVPIAYPRLNFLENVLTSRALDPIKALGRAGLFSGFVNKFDGGVEILDDLDDHWTAKHHKSERNWFIQELQELAAEKSIRITILGGDVHLAAVGQFYSNPKLGIPKDHDHRYMPNVISSAIVNTPPPEMMADVLNKRNKTHHLDRETDEDMIPMFLHDVNGKSRNNRHLLPRRNWCSIRQYEPGSTPPATPPPEEAERSSSRRRSFSFSRSRSRSRQDGESRGIIQRFSSRKAPPSSYRNPNNVDDGNPYSTSNLDPRVDGPLTNSRQSGDLANSEERGRSMRPRSNSFSRLPTSLTRRASRGDRSGRQGRIDLQGGLDIVINCEIDQTDPSGFTMPYRLIVPALNYYGGLDTNTANPKAGTVARFLGSRKRNAPNAAAAPAQNTGYDSTYNQSDPSAVSEQQRNGNFAATGAATGLGVGAATLAVAGASSNQEGHLFGEIPSTGSSQARNLSAPPSSAQYSAQQDRPVSSGQSYERSSTGTQYGSRDQTSAVRVNPRRALPVRRLSASGPTPPANLDQLPASVRKRYEQLNDPEQNERLRQVDATSSRYAGLNSPTNYQRYSQNESLAESRQISSQPGSQRQSMAPQQPPVIPRPAPPPQPYETHRRYSGAPMEMPLLPTNINQLRSSNHRTLQDTGAFWGEPTTKRSASDPAPKKSASASAAYHKAQLAGGSYSMQSTPPNRPDSFATNGESKDVASSEAASSRPVSTAVMPPMVPLSRGQARKSYEIPSYPSPLTSHSTKDTYLFYGEPQNQAFEGQSSSRGIGLDNSQERPSGSLPANPTKPLDRQYSDAAYGYRSSYDGDLHSGTHNKVARHFGGFQSTQGAENGQMPHEYAYDERYEDDNRRSRGLSGVVRRFSSRRKRREMDREERDRARNSAYSEEWFDAQENYDDYGSGDDYSDPGHRQRNWKFWQR